MKTARINGQTKRFGILGMGVLLGLAAALALATMSPGGAADEPEPIVTELLTDRAEFTDDVAMQLRNKFDGRGTDVTNMRDASNIAVAKLTIQPGATFPWHTHPGPVLITIAEGEFTYVLADDCVERDYRGGHALIDAGGDNIHTAFNPGETQTVVVATFLNASDEGPLTVPVEPDEASALDDKCGIQTGAHEH